MSLDPPDIQSAGARRVLLAFPIAVLLAYAILLALFFDRVGLRDNDHAVAAHHQQYWNQQLFGIARQWSPLMCGGLSLAANPFVHFFSLSMALGYLCGPFLGLRLAVVAYLATGFASAYLYAGLMLRDRLLRLVAAALFVGNGFFICRLAYGHLNLVPFLTLPLVLYVLHRRGALAHSLGGPLLGGALLAVLLGGLLALVSDGSPQAFVHFLVWIGLYALALAVAERSVAAPVLFASACVVGAVLDLGYLWPVLGASAEFPRLTSDDFANPLHLLWFLIVPSSGALLPTRYMGQEMSVWIGPVVAWLLWRHRREVRAQVPARLALPWLVAGGVSVLLGMGSLKLIGVPAWLSPFDLLRSLPGFRSMGATARYWGFLALPLSMAGALAVGAFASAPRIGRGRLALLGLALALQVGFQLGAIGPPLLASRRYHAPAIPDGFVTARTPDAPGVEVEWAYTGGRGQSEVIAPARGAIDCYDNSDYRKARMLPGHDVVQGVWRDGQPVFDGPAVSGRFLTWSRIRLELPRTLRAGPLRIVLNQAFNRHWTASAGQAVELPSGNLGLDIPAGGPRSGRVDLRFDDPASRRGAAVSMLAWRAWLGAALLAVAIGWRRRDRQAVVPTGG
jgi:hypothetical protein